MNTVSFLQLVQNTALLLSLVLVFDVFALRWHVGQGKFSRYRLAAGLIIGAIGVVVMLTPWVLLPGLVFDTRSVLLSISGLFFGTVPTLIAMGVTGILRVFQGGPGVWPGVSTVVVTGSLGLIWRHMRRQQLDEIKLPELYLFGFVTHLIMLALMFTLPLEMALHTLRNIGVPVMIIYPLASTLLGGLMINRLKREKLIDEQRQAEETLAQERRLLRTVINNLPIAIYAKDAQARKTLANRTDLDNIGLPETEVLGKTDRELFPPEIAARFEADDRTVLNSGTPVYDREELLTNRYGKTFWQLTSKVPLYDADGQVVGLVGIGRDITERRQQELERAALLEAEHEQRLRAETLRDVTLALASTLGVSDVLMEVLRQAERLVPSVASNIALVEDEALHIVGWRGYAESGIKDEFAMMHQPLAEYPINAELVATGEPYITGDTYTDPRWQRLPASAWIRSHISLPISLGEDVLGVLRLDSDQVGAFSAQDVERLRPLAHAAAVALKNAQLYAQAQHELEERIRSQAALEASERKFREMLENMHLFAVILDLEGRVTFCNDFGLQLVGMERDEILGCDWFETFIPPEIRAEMRATFAQHFATGNFPPHHENEILIARNTDGTARVLIAWNNMIVRDSNGEIIGVAAVGEDITVRRQAERALQASEAWLRALVDEKTLMLTEIHHRIKNNLQVILGLLDLQFGAVKDEGTQQMLRESRNRIKAIALIHERLYQTPGESQVGAQLYFHALINYLIGTYDAMVRGIVVEQSIDDLKLNIDLAIPCALIVNELISNALKYAFPPGWQSPDGAPPTLRVALHSTDGHARLAVADNGVGLLEGLELESSSHLGLRLIKMLARQIDGELHIEHHNGTHIVITFAWSEEK